MSKLLLTLLLALLGYSGAFADVCTIGTGTTTLSYPFYTFYEDGKSQMIYTKADMEAAFISSSGMINSIAFDFTQLGVGAGAPLGSFKIYLNNYTSATLPASDYAPEGTLVYSSANATPALGWYTFPFSTPFEWDGNSNLLVTVCFDNDDYGTTYMVNSTACANTLIKYNYMDNQTGCTTPYANFAHTNPANRPNIKLDIDMKPSIVSFFPQEGTVLQTGLLYSGANHPGMIVKKKPTHPAVEYSYKITGPAPYTTEVYRALETGSLNDEFIPVTTSSADPFEIRIDNCDMTRLIAGAGGSLDLTNAALQGGKYTITGVMRTPDLSYVKTFSSSFYIALENDILVSNIVTPKEKTKKKYATGQVPLKATVMNAGVNPVTNFKLYAEIYQNGNMIKALNPITWNQPASPLITGATTDIEFPNWTTNLVGEFTIKYFVELIGAADQSHINDTLSNVFLLAYDQEPQALSVERPAQNEELYVGVPVIPQFKVANNGITDMTRVPVNMRIYQGTTLTDAYKVYDYIKLVADIPSGITNNTAYTYMEDAFVPPAPGIYTVVIEIQYANDPYKANNTITQTFTVSAALSGDYTIGTLNSGAINNFNTFDDALNMLFKRGVSGPVIFRLTDPVYNVGKETETTYPAMDLRSHIVGMDATNTVTFKPSDEMSIVHGGIRINLLTGNGKGIVFGQSDNPANIWAPVKLIRGTYKPRFSNSEGYFIWDGGSQKSIIITLKTTSPFRAPIYMSNAKNITIKNCLIQDGLNQNSSWECVLPLSSYNASFNKIETEADMDINRTYSSGVVIRSVAPLFEKSNNNYYNLDTICSNNITIKDNEISGFAYGISSMGIGCLFYSSEAFAGYQAYYNHHNTFEGNTISNVGRAGIFLGYEDNTKVSRNRIYNVAGNCSGDAAGILVGGEARQYKWGYSNVNVDITRNEISNIQHASNVYGIKIQQSQITMNDPSHGVINFPVVEDKIRIINNSIWGLAPTSVAANAYGVRMFTDRLNDDFLTPHSKTQLIDLPYITNNTIVIDGDNAATTGSLIGIALQQADSAIIYNNAIAVLDNNFDASSLYSSAIFFQGMNPKYQGIIANRNAFYTPYTDIYRFVETDKYSTIVNPGFKGEYVNLHQWQQFANNDWQSVYSNFMTDMAYVGANPSKLRVKSTPTYPKNSVLNNRGDRVAPVTEDIDGNVRGVAHQRYDIGACEFNGGFYTSDLELLNIVTPGSYRDLRSTSMFNDAEYIMTTAPVDVSARIRNNGNIQQTNVNMNLKIYRENPAEHNVSNFVGTLELEKSIKVTLSSTDDNVFSFGLAGLTDNWKPSTYAELNGTGYTVPDNFTSMKPNVTPRYRLEVSIADNADEYLTNNKVSKVVRFYLKKSGLNILISAENSNTAINNSSNMPLTSITSVDKVAGRLNADTLIANLKRIGWEVDYNAEKPRYDIDLFERNGWEPRNVNYTDYRSLIWSDGDDKRLTRQQVLDLTRFLTTDNATDKKNLIVASQEFTRMNTDTTVNEVRASKVDYLYLVNDLMRNAYTTRTGTNNPADKTNADVVGATICKYLTTKLITTTWNNGTIADAQPLCVNTDIYSNNLGVAQPAFYFTQPSAAAANQRIMGVSTITQRTNVVTLGVDWRHFLNAEFVFRGIIDFIEQTGTIVPVELMNFDAEYLNSNVVMSWQTASEIGSDRFEIERANVNPTGITSYAKIAEVKASGNTSSITNYGPIVDNKVVAGNTYSYRLKLVDANGDYTYSNEKVVTTDGTSGAWMNAPTPNPVSTNSTIEFGTATESNVNITVYDLNGKSVLNLFDGIVKGTNTITISNTLPSGAYVVVLRSGDIVVKQTVNIVR